MAKLPFAFSIEINDIIDAEQAYELFWSGIIQNGSAFNCPEENCEGNATCINVDKAENDMLQHPHFRGYNHNRDCIHHPEKVKALSKGNSTSSGSRSQLDELFLARPEKEAGTTSNAVETTTRVHGTKDQKSNKVYRAKYFTIRSLVSKFVEHRKKNEEREHHVKIDAIKLSYKDLFIGVYNQDYDSLPRYNRIYWGVAFLDKDPAKEHYKIRFAEAFKLNGEEIRPSFLLYENLIDSYHSRLIKTRINQYSKGKSPRVLIFIYSKPFTPKNEGKYINLKIENLDMLDIRGLDFFEKLKKD